MSTFPKVVGADEEVGVGAVERSPDVEGLFAGGTENPEGLLPAVSADGALKFPFPIRVLLRPWAPALGAGDRPYRKDRSLKHDLLLLLLVGTPGKAQLHLTPTGS